jgi:hypothetical protein
LRVSQGRWLAADKQFSSRFSSPHSVTECLFQSVVAEGKELHTLTAAATLFAGHSASYPSRTGIFWSMAS